jgi:uncharacterized membrane protein YgaE (UPF0421/DUF939 family)
MLHQSFPKLEKINSSPSLPKKKKKIYKKKKFTKKKITKTTKRHIGSIDETKTKKKENKPKLSEQKKKKLKNLILKLKQITFKQMKEQCEKPVNNRNPNKKGFRSTQFPLLLSTDLVIKQQDR